jgi:glucose/arabinose dehydrogenase
VPTAAATPLATATPPAPPAAASPAPLPSPTATAIRPGATPQVQIFISGLDTPWAIAFAPDGRFFLTERPGRIRVVTGGKLDPAPWLTLEVAEAGEGGLLGLALDPQFAQNRFVYVAYTYRADGSLRNRLVRLREDAATGKGVLDKVLLDSVRGNSTHDGGRVRFGPDGKLYWTMGDVQDTAAAQDPAALVGKILRLNADGSIPADNPFPGSPVYSFGHRNPQGLAWQPGTGRLYATEHGPSGGQGCCQDEVNLIEPGKNYGWPEITGDKARAGMVSPVIHSGASDTWAPGGADFVTAGPWQGALLFTGLRGQALYRLTLDPADPRKALALQPLLKGVYGRLRDVAQGPDGAIYVLTSNGDGRGVLPADGDRVLRLAFTN